MAEEKQMRGLLGLDPLSAVTANQGMLEQAIKSRFKTPMQMQPLTTQGLLDGAALATSPVPILGDLLGLGADANRFYNEPESRTPLNFGLAALGAIPFIPPLVSAGLGKFAQSQGKQLAQMPSGPARNQAGAIVYHGSPHKFDQFDSSKIGTGEGAQAYGHGMYFAENPSVAKEYQKNLSPTGKDWEYFTSIGGNANATNKVTGDVKVFNTAGEREAWMRKLTSGSLYKVDLPDEAIAKMLDWDKPLSQQSAEVREILKNTSVSNDISTKKRIADYAKARGMSIEQANEFLLSHPETLKRMRAVDGDFRGDQLYRAISKVKSGNLGGSNYLGAIGIPGIRYLDGGSRAAGEGTRNFVVFPGNEGLLKILERQ